MWKQSILILAIVLVLGISAANATVIDAAADGLGDAGHSGTINDPLDAGETIYLKFVLRWVENSFPGPPYYPSYDGYVLAAMDLTLTASSGTMDVGAPGFQEHADWTFTGGPTIVSNVLDTGPYASSYANIGTTPGILAGGSDQDILWGFYVTAGEENIVLTFGQPELPACYFDYTGDGIAPDPEHKHTTLADLGNLTIYVAPPCPNTIPDCWYYATQCHADVNDDGDVGLYDFRAFRDSWGCEKDIPCGTGKAYNPCADTDRNGNIGITDYYQFRDNWGTTGIYAPPDANCPQGDIHGIYCPRVSFPGPASNPSPTDTQTDVSVTTDLNWTAGPGANSHDVYLGTNWNDVNDANTNSSEFMGNQDTNSYDPCTLDYDTTYYWRVDEVNLGGTTTGDVWYFTTEVPPVPGQATNPSPADTQADVNAIACLSWVAGPNATSHDVYFGTTSPGDFQGNQTDTTFCPPNFLEYSTTYYWRIDENNPYNTVTGEVWRFTTMVDPNLVGWWKFNETSGSTAYDSTDNENHGMLVGLVWEPGQGAVNFDGSNNLSRVVVPTAGMTTTAGTFAIWANLAEPQIRGDGRNGNAYFFGCDNGGTNKILLYMNNSNTLLDMKVGNHGENNLTTLSTETWYHIALTWNAGTYAVYVNGSPLDTGTYGGLNSLPSTADIGNNGNSSTQSLHGLVGEVMIYDKALSADEVDQLYQDGAN